jgi:AraC-like DNA-binding protein
VARLAESDRSGRRLSDLCEVAGIGARSLQRMFLRYAGVSPAWVIRRFRLLEAAETVRDGRPASRAAGGWSLRAGQDRSAMSGSRCPVLRAVVRAAAVTGVAIDQVAEPSKPGFLRRE